MSSAGQIGIRMNGEEILLNQGDCLYFSSDSCMRSAASATGKPKRSW